MAHKKKDYKKKRKQREEDKIERDKHLLMVTGVSFFMTLIIVLWFLNIDSVLNVKQMQSSTNNNKKEEVKMNEVKSDMANIWQNLQDQLEQAKDMREKEATTSPQNVSPSTSKEMESTSSPQRLNDIKKDLEDNIDQNLN